MGRGTGIGHRNQTHSACYRSQSLRWLDPALQDTKAERLIGGVPVTWTWLFESDKSFSFKLSFNFNQGTPHQERSIPFFLLEPLCYNDGNSRTMVKIQT